MEITPGTGCVHAGITPTEFAKSVARTQSDDNTEMVREFIHSRSDSGDLIESVLSDAIYFGERADLLKKAIFHGHPHLRSGISIEESRHTVLDYLTPRHSTDEYPYDRGALIMTALGLIGETAELVKHIAHVIFVDTKLDADYVKKELGDILWYDARGANALGIKFGDVMQANVDKLLKRYPDGFSTERSLNRTDE